MNKTVVPLSWSKSRSSAFGECRRKGLFFLFVTQGEEAGNLPRGEDVQSLKKLKNRFLWSGSLVHETIGAWVKKLQHGEGLPPLEQALDEVRTRMREEYKSSKEKEEGAPRLYEHHYAVSIGPDDWRTTWNSVEKSLRWFHGSSWAVKLAALPPESWKMVDELVNFEVEGINTYAKLDCALDLEGRIVLIDWKTGALKDNGNFNAATAALYAYEVWDADLERLDYYEVSLSTGKNKKIPVNEETLMETVLKIQEDAALFAEAWEQGKTDPFQLPMASPGVCARCNFQAVCFDSENAREKGDA